MTAAGAHSDRNVGIIAGLDPSGGAGIIADVRVAQMLGVRAVGVVSCTTVQDTSGVRDVQAINAEHLSEQLHALLSDVQVHGVKIGMLGSADVLEVVVRGLNLTGAPVVWDPVLAPTAGHAALYSDSLARALDALAPHLAVVCPNLKEAAALVGREVSSKADMISAAQQIGERGQCAVLVTGGHLAGTDVVDVLWHKGSAVEFCNSRLDSGEVHGTGCALSTALAARLACDVPLKDAVGDAIGFVREHIASRVRPGRGLAAVV